MADEPDLTHARQLFHHRDARLDEPYGEGVELTLFALPDGRLFQKKYRYHLDFDGTHDDRVISRAQAIEAVQTYGGTERAVELFPDE
jgi:hypothetical protein